MTDTEFGLVQAVLRTRAVRAWTGSAYPEPPRKRNSTFIRTVVADEALTEFRAALAIDRNRDDIMMMTQPTFTFDLLDEYNERLVVLGYISGGWVRCAQLSDQQLIDPRRVERWIDKWVRT